jgi:hypothetical protein
MTLKLDTVGISLRTENRNSSQLMDSVDSPALYETIAVNLLEKNSIVQLPKNVASCPFKSR